MPPVYDIEAALLDFPVRYDECMNTVLVQELIRFNRVNSTVADSLKEIQRAVRGLVVMSGEVGFTTSTRSAASYTPTRAAGLTSARYRLRGDAYRIRSPSITPSSRPWETPW